MTRLLKTLRYSLSARLMLLFIITAILIAMVMRQGMGLALRHQFEQNLRPHIVEYLKYIHREIGNPPDIDKARELARRLPVDIIIEGPVVNWSSLSGPLDLSQLRFHAPKRVQTQRLTVARYDDRFVLRTLTGEHVVFLLVRGRAGFAHGPWVGLLSLAAILLILYACYRAIRWLFAPISDIRQTVQRLGDGELDCRVPVRRKDELGVLGTNINAMADDIKKMLDAKRQLLLAISHELRSPITRATVSLELLERSETTRAIKHDLAEMESMIGELLETERLNTAHDVLNRAPVSINGLITEVIGEHFADRAIDTSLSEEDPYTMLDGPRIKLLIRNLLDNALRHNGEKNPPPRIESEIDEATLSVNVIDHGDGIDAEHLPHLSEPFYRVDASRQRKTGGYGLGLYLCRVIAEAHGGRLTVESRANEGTVVRVSFPLG
jgi:signal transduction histidine kinase